MHKKHLQNIIRTSQYNHDRSHFLRLDANERVIPFEKKTIKDLKKIVNDNVLQSYPSAPKKLASLISKKEKISNSYINLVPGSDSAIKFIFENFTGTNLKVISLYPTYGMIDVYSKIYRIKLKKVNENNVEKFFSLNRNYNDVAFIYIANPNQPSGKIIDKKIIEKIIKMANLRKKVLLIDEAYIDFANQKSCTNLVKKYKNLIVLKTFSKSTGIAGLRIGYVICNPKFAKVLNSVRSIFDITHFSLKVAEYFLSNNKIIKNYINKIRITKKFVKKQCEKRNLKFLNTEANFFYIFLDLARVNKIYNFLKNKKILVKSKHTKGFKVLNNSLRMTYGSKKQISYFFKQFDKIYKR